VVAWLHEGITTSKSMAQRPYDQYWPQTAVAPLTHMNSVRDCHETDRIGSPHPFLELRYY